MPLPYCVPADEAPPGEYQCPCHSQKPLIAPSVLACDLSKLTEESMGVLAAGADVLHLDVMDGNFVPNISFGWPVIASVRKNLPNAYLDVHMMVADPGKWVPEVAKAVQSDLGAPSQYTFHIEATDDPKGVIEAIRATGMRVGIAIKPDTGVPDIEELIPLVDTVLVMTVEPGFGGQSFMGIKHPTHNVMPKVLDVRTRFPDKDIEVDGGLSAATIGEAARAGANMIVAGSAVFKGEPAPVIAALRREVQKFGNGMSEEQIEAESKSLAATNTASQEGLLQKLIEEKSALIASIEAMRAQ